MQGEETVSPDSLMGRLQAEAQRVSDLQRVGTASRSLRSAMISGGLTARQIEATGSRSLHSELRQAELSPAM